MLNPHIEACKQHIMHGVWELEKKTTQKPVLQVATPLYYTQYTHATKIMII
jgi:hypothetical protein